MSLVLEMMAGLMFKQFQADKESTACELNQQIKTMD